jgi:hypothetical protein
MRRTRATAAERTAPQCSLKGQRGTPRSDAQKGLNDQREDFPSKGGGSFQSVTVPTYAATTEPARIPSFAESSSGPEPNAQRKSTS